MCIETTEDEARQPDETKVSDVEQNFETPKAIHVYSPRLVRQEQADDLVIEMLEETDTVIPTGFRIPVKDVLPTVVERLVHALHPEKIILFGSYAYGMPTPDSDVDLLVIMDTNGTQTERYMVVSRLIYPRPFPVDILVKRPDEIQHALESGDFFIEEIVTKGQTLYERSN